MGATISKEGQVDLGPKMSMFIIDNNHIATTSAPRARHTVTCLTAVIWSSRSPTSNRRRDTVSAATSCCIPMTPSMTNRSSRRRTRHEKADDHSGFGDHGNSGSHSGRYGRQNHRQGLIGSILNQSKRQYRRTADGTVCPVCGSLLSERKIANLQHIVRGGSTWIPIRQLHAWVVDKCG